MTIADDALCSCVPVRRAIGLPRFREREENKERRTFGTLVRLHRLLAVLCCLAILDFFFFFFFTDARDGKRAVAFTSRSEWSWSCSSIEKNKKANFGVSQCARTAVVLWKKDFHFWLTADVSVWWRWLMTLRIFAYDIRYFIRAYIFLLVTKSMYIIN